MAGTTMSPSTGGAFSGQVGPSGQQFSAATVNSLRVAAVAERLATRFGSGHVHDPKEFFNLCLCLARGIDYAVANNQVPETIRKIPSLLKTICQHRNDLFLQAAIMVLLISVKSACKIGWFSGKETEELLTLANETGSSFCHPGHMGAEANHSLVTISTIIRRFYPQMKMGQILASLEVKPGYGAYVTDFNILKQTSHSAVERLHLFVAQKDNLETSACIITPLLVNFLLNGKAVEGRTNVNMDSGPQLPTNVTSMLKYGTNLLQSVGQFNGNYIIVVAFMSVTPSQDIPVLQEYVQPAVPSPDLDSDIIEGQSRVSLNCPISRKRIKTPVKGLSCKHLQCFDFSNFIDINSRRPSWRCPHCNQYACYIDIRVDQNMVKILKDVGNCVDGVMVSADGSWTAVTETTTTDKVDQQEPSSTLDVHPLVLDLINDDDEMTSADTREIEDVKPFQANPNCQSPTPNSTKLPGLNNSNEIDQNAGARAVDDYWSSLYFSSFAREDAQVAGGISQLGSPNSLPAPMLTDSSPPARALNQESGVSGGANLSTLVTSGQNSAPNDFQSQASELDNLVRNEYGRSSLIPRHVRRTPVAIQALPAQSPSPSLPERSRPSVNSPTTNGPGPAFQAHQSRVPSANERQQQVSRSDMDAAQVAPGHSGQRVPGGGYIASSQILTDFQNSHLQQAFNQRMPPSLSPTSERTPSPQVPQTQAQQAAVQMPRQSQTCPAQVHNTTTVPISPINGDRLRAPAGGQNGNARLAESATRTDGLVNMASEQNWRPTGRMRGSLQGSAYTAALSEFMMIRPTPPAQATRPYLTSLPTIPNVSSVSDPARNGGSATQP